MEIQDYHQISTTISFHQTPRSGFSNNFADLLSPEALERSNYRQGIFSFGVFLLIFWVIWLMILFALKYIFGLENVGCAASDEIIDVQYIKRHKRHLKPHLQSMVKRSWRIQTAFLWAAFLIPISTWLFLEKGLAPTMTSLDEIYGIILDISSVTDRGEGIAKALITEQERIQTLNVDELLDLESFCPLLNNQSSVIISENEASNLFMSNSSQELLSVIENYDEIVSKVIHKTQAAFETINGFTEGLEDSVAHVISSDWKVKMYLLVLNVVNVFLIFGVLLNRNNIVYFPFKCIIVWLLVPVLIILLLLAAIAASGFGMAVSVNSDFCSGGMDPGSPISTIEDIILQYNNTKQDLLYSSFQYFITDCTTENPLGFVAEYEHTIRTTKNHAKDFIRTINNFGVQKVNRQCGSDILPMMEGIQRLAKSMGTIEANIKFTQELSSCSVLNPILRRIFHGSACNQAVDGMAWMFGATFSITFLCLIMISTRAGLYNATIRKARRRRKDATEKEWGEYKRFMAQFYDDSHRWKMEPSPHKKDPPSIEGIPSCDTGITETTSTADEESAEDVLYQSFDSESDATDAGQFLSPCRKEQTFVEQVKTAEKIRKAIDVLDGELMPLTPSSAPMVDIDISGNNATPLHRQLETERKVQNSISSINDALAPLTPSSRSLDYADRPGGNVLFQNTEQLEHHSNPKAPQKSQKNLQRTSQRKVLW